MPRPMKISIHRSGAYYKFKVIGGNGETVIPRGEPFTERYNLMVTVKKLFGVHRLRKVDDNNYILLPASTKPTGARSIADYDDASAELRRIKRASNAATARWKSWYKSK